MKKVCIFDLDGTLTNTLETLAHFVNTEIAKHGLSAIPTEHFRYFAGSGAQMLIHRALAYHNVKDESMEKIILPAYSAAYDADFLYLTELYDGIPELITELKRRNMQLAVLSNKPHQTAEKVVRHFFGTDTFHCMFGQREGVPRKPDPAGVYEILKIMPHEKEDCLYIGDTAIDMNTGNSAGLETVGVLWGFRERTELEEAGADHIIEKPAELLALL